MRASRLSMLVMGVAFVGMGAVAAVTIFRIDLGLSTGATVLPIALIVGGTVLVGEVVLRGFAPPCSMMAPLVTMLVVYASTVLVGFPPFERTRPITAVTRFLKTHAAVTDSVGLYKLERWRPSIRYYVGRRVERLETLEHLRAFLRSSETSYVVMLADEYPQVQAAGLDVDLVFTRAAVSATEGQGFRRQIWSYLAVVRRRSNQDLALK